MTNIFMISDIPQQAHVVSLRGRKIRSGKLKTAQEALDKQIDAKYPVLTEVQIKTLVIDDKWMAHLVAAVQGELDRVAQTLTGHTMTCWCRWLRNCSCP